MNRVCASTDCYVYCLWQFFCMCIHSNCKKENSKNKQQEKLSSFRRTMHNCMLVYTVKWNIVYDRKWKERERKKWAVYRTISGNEIYQKIWILSSILITKIKRRVITCIDTCLSAGNRVNVYSLGIETLQLKRLKLNFCAQ